MPILMVLRASMDDPNARFASPRHPTGRRYRVMSDEPRDDELRYFFAAARSTKVLPPFILCDNGASLIWMTTASASTPRFFTSACVMSRIMPAFCSSVRPAAMLTVISGIFYCSRFSFLSSWPGALVPDIHDLRHQTRRGCPAQAGHDA